MVSIYMHPSFYRALKLKLSMDVGKLSRDGRVTAELGTDSLSHAIGIPSPEDFLILSKVIAFDVSKHCHFEDEGTEISNYVFPLACWLSNLGLDVVAMQETHFTCTADCRVQENDFVVLWAYCSSSSVGVSQLVGCSLKADVNLVLADDGGWLVVADVAVESFQFRVSRFMRPISLLKGFLFFDFWRRSSTIWNG